MQTGARLSATGDGRVSVDSLEANQDLYQPLRLAGRDVVYWALSYPVVLTSGEGAVGEAAGLLAAGAIEDASAALAKAPESAEKAALESVIATAQEDQPLALARADAAVEMAPNAVAPRLARSYALQSQFRLEQARDDMRHAAEQAPDDALVWPRLAELELMLGDRRAARTFAERASELADTSQSAIVEGFAALAERRQGQAAERFAHARSLDSEQPLAWLGQGLAQILGGDLAEGRASLENGHLA